MYGKVRIVSAIFFLVINVVVASSLTVSFAEAKRDTDLDGLSDEAENNVYKTDPTLSDTDGDSILDFQEILDNTDPLDSRSNRVRQAVPVKFGIREYPLMWTVGRIAGVSSFIMFTLVIVMGLTMTSKILLKYRLISPSDVMETHLFTATYMAFILLLVHVFSFVFDDYILMKIPEIFVPFLFDRNVTTDTGFRLNTAVAIGVIALYLSVLLLVTSHLRNKIIPSRIWRALHYSSFLFYILFLVHAFTAGSDSNETWLKVIYISSLTIVLFLIILRIFGKKYFLPKPVKRPLPEKTNSITQIT